MEQITKNKIEKFFCYKCDKQFLDKKTLLNHLKKCLALILDDDSKIDIFSQLSLYKNLEKTEYEQRENKDFFPTVEKFTRNNKKANIYFCPFCLDCIIQDIDGKYQIITKRNNSLDYSSGIKYNSAKEALDQHIEKYHFFYKEVIFPCAYCDFFSFIQDETRFHMLKEHFDLEIFPCVYCNMNFSCLDSLKEHSNNCNTLNNYLKTNSLKRKF